MKEWILSGLFLVIYGLVVSSCTVVVPESDESPGTIDSVESAEAALKAERIATYGPIWKEESTENGDHYAAGLAAWNLAAATEESSWSNAAIQSLKKALQESDNVNRAQIKAWLGSSHALMARDFPVQGWWQVIPGPGFVRLYHVRKSLAYLDEAVDMAPMDPIVRLIRGTTYLGMPALFGGREEGRGDFALMKEWITDPQLNAEYADVIRSQSWLEEYYLSCARSMMSLGNKEEEARCWRQLFSITNNPATRKLAKWRLN